MPVAEGLAQPLQRLAVQRLRGGEVALGVKQVAEVVDGDERAWMPITERLAVHHQRLAKQRLSFVELALSLHLISEGVQGEAGALTTRALGLEPCTQELKAQRVAVMVHALAAAVGCVLLWALAPPPLEAVAVGQLGGAAAGARLHESGGNQHRSHATRNRTGSHHRCRTRCSARNPKYTAATRMCTAATRKLQRRASLRATFGLLQCTLGLLQLTGCVHCSVRQRVYWRTPRRRDTNPGAPRLHLPSLGYSPGPVSCAALCTEQMPRPWQEPLSRGRGNTNSSIMLSKLCSKQARRRPPHPSR
eukprot:scaffold31553_cov63-Phaeocystis_antarctica.AAC.3